MSKSRKKQRARAQNQQDAVVAHLTKTVPVAETAPEVTPPASPEKPAQPLNQALYDLAVAAATNAGQMREEGDRLSWVYNGDALAMKYTEPGDEDSSPARLMVAAFRRGVVFQVEGERQVVYQAGDWEAELTRLATAEAAAPEDEGDEPDGPDDGDDDEQAPE